VLSGVQTPSNLSDFQDFDKESICRFCLQFKAQGVSPQKKKEGTAYIPATLNQKVGLC